MNTFMFPNELLQAIKIHTVQMQEVSLGIMKNNISKYPMIIAYWDGIKWCPTFIQGSSLTSGWSFAITYLEEMVEIGAISTNAFNILKSMYKDPEKYFNVFNVEIERISIMNFPFEEVRFRPDLGIYLSQNAKPGTTFNFVPFKIYSLSRIKQNLYSTTANTTMSGNTFCMTADFIESQYIKVIKIMPKEISSKVKRIFRQPFKNVQTIDLPCAIECGISTRLGKKVCNKDEDFIPFEVIDVFRYPK